MGVIDLVVAGLATHQVVVLWFNGSLLIRLRQQLSRIHPIIREGQRCPVCVSVWCGIAVVGLWEMLPTLVWVLAVIDVAGLVEVPNRWLQRPVMISAPPVPANGESR